MVPTFDHGVKTLPSLYTTTALRPRTQFNVAWLASRERWSQRNATPFARITSLERLIPTTEGRPKHNMTGQRLNFAN